MLGGGIGLIGDGVGKISDLGKKGIGGAANLGGKAIGGAVELGKRGIDSVSNNTYSTN